MCMKRRESALSKWQIPNGNGDPRMQTAKGQKESTMMWNRERRLRVRLKKGSSFLGAALAMLLWASCRCTCPELLRAEAGYPCHWCMRKEQWAESG